MELISVVVITFNSSKTVIETLESIRNQTYANLELIVSDDCSTDNTIEIVRGWVRRNHKRFTNVRILKAKNNHGITKNCNIAINQAHGKYIQLIAGDDVLMEQAIERKRQFAEKNQLNVVFTKIEVFGSDKPRVNEMKKFCERGYRIVKKGWQEQYDNIIFKNFAIGPSASFYLTEYILKVGGFDIRYPMVEDYPFIYHYILAGNEFVLLEEELVKYRISNSSVWASKNNDFSKSVAKFFFLERFWEQIKNKNIKRALCGIRGNLFRLLR